MESQHSCSPEEVSRGKTHVVPVQLHNNQYVIMYNEMLSKVHMLSAPWLMFVRLFQNLNEEEEEGDEVLLLVSVCTCVCVYVFASVFVCVCVHACNCVSLYPLIK